MATRNDVTITYVTSPRIIEVQAPSTEIIMQDLVDTLRSREDDFHGGLAYPKLVDASGKEDLGGGVKVGITVALQDAKLAFEGRTTPAAVGVVTSTTPSLIAGTQRFTDSSADFAAAGIQRGSLVINFTDQSIADIIEVMSSTELLTKTLVNGTTNTYTIGDDYQVFNVIQCNASGGNLTAVDENGDPISSILPTAFTQVVLTASSSATLQEQTDIQYASFDGAVHVDITSPFSGTAFPVGTPRQPVNNMTDALSIATTRGFDEFHIYGSITIDSGLDYSGYSFKGQSKSLTTLIIDSAATVVECEFRNATITGTLDGNSRLEECVVTDLVYVNGYIEECVLTGTLTLGGGNTAYLIDCVSGPVGGVIIDLGGSGQGLIARNFNGAITISNHTGTDPVSLDMNSGTVLVDSTVIAGTISIRGIAIVTDNSTPPALVYDQTETRYIRDIHGHTPREIHIDTTSITNGVSGYQQLPFNNVSDGLDFAQSRGVFSVALRSGAATLDRTLTDFRIRGINYPLINLNGQNLNSSYFSQLTLAGIHTGTIYTDNVRTSSTFTTTGLRGTSVEADGTWVVVNGSTVIQNGMSVVSDGTPLTLDLQLGGAGSTVGINGVAGDVNVVNVDSPNDVVQIHGNGATITLDASVTNGTIEITGDATVIDNSGGAANVVVSTSSARVWDVIATDHVAAGTTGLMLNQIKADTLQLSLDTINIIDLATTLIKYQGNRNKIDATAKTLTVYDDDGITPIKVFNLKDFSGAPSITQVAERVPV